MSKQFEDLIRQLLENNVPVGDLSLVDGRIACRLSGFYKSSGLSIYEDDGVIYALARYGEVDALGENPFESLVRINYRWWQSSKDRYEGWKNPEACWLPHFLRMGLVKEVSKTEVTYE
jgi:hypothetical protein